MRGWSWMLSGLVIWIVHFGAIYAAASLDAQTPQDDRALWRSVVIVATIICLAGCGAVLARSRLGTSPTLVDRLAALGSGGAVVAIVWQAIAALLG